MNTYGNITPGDTTPRGTVANVKQWCSHVNGTMFVSIEYTATNGIQPGSETHHADEVVTS